MRFSRVGRLVAALLLAFGGVVLVASPSYAACGDSQTDWVGSLGSTWSGTMDGSTSFTVALLPPVLGVQVAATVIVAQSGVGTWVYDYDLRWTASLAGVWSYRFEVTSSDADCSDGQVSAAGGAGTDANNTLHYITMTRTG